MGDSNLYNQALKEVTELAVDTIIQCVEFANRNDYEKKLKFREVTRWMV